MLELPHFWVDWASERAAFRDAIESHKMVVEF
jgi:hypothetical protein